MDKQPVTNQEPPRTQGRPSETIENAHASGDGALERSDTQSGEPKPPDAGEKKQDPPY